MKGQRIFPSVILIGFGLYFLLETSNISLFPGFYSWRTLLCIVGLAFLSQAYIGKNYDAILPGTILFGLGIHFHLIRHFDAWPNHNSMFLFIISIGFILQSRKTNTGLFYGIIICILALFLIFYDKLLSLMDLTAELINFWPFILITIGLYVIIRKK